MSPRDQSSHRRLDPRSIEVVIIAAYDREGAIGKDGDLPWHLPADLKHFKEMTLGRPVVMGRRTHESIGRALPGRLNIVLSRDAAYSAPGCEVASSLEQALQIAARQGRETIMIIGGATVYEQALPLTDRLILTIVDDRVDGDTFFPDYDPQQWEEVQRHHRPADEANPVDLTFLELRRSRCES